jgi:methylmalonyl-CoA/ethylmalonyl-CoA epimerase
MEELKSYVTAVDHVGIAVADLKEAIEFYRDVLGLELYHEEVNEAEGVHEAMLRPPGGAAGATAVQLLAPLGPDTTIAKFLARKGPGVQQVAYRVSDIAAAADALRAKGLRVMYETARPGTANSRANFVHPKDTGGVLIELVEPAPEER